MPRLFVCSNATGNLKVEEIMDFNQSDLIDDDVMLLDTWNYIFVWIGDHSNPEEKKLAEEAALVCFFNLPNSFIVPLEKKW